MNWHASLVALTIVVGIFMVLSGIATACSERWDLMVRVFVPAAVAFVLLIGLVNA